MRTSPVIFTFPYRVNGLTAADFDCRATADARLGKPAVRYQNNGDPGWPAEAPEVEDFDDIEVDVVERRLTAEEKAAGKPGFYKHIWAAPDDHLRDLILAWLEAGNADDAFLDALAEDLKDEADRRDEYRAEARRESLPVAAE